MRPRRNVTGRARAVAAMALATIAASTLLGGSARAQTADDVPSLGGYNGTAHASGVHAFYNPEGLLPTAAVLDAGAPDALATISRGVTFARAAVADPGDLLVNPDALFSQADPRYPQGTLPAYPYRITANSTVGEPRAESKPAPGLDARVEATDSGSTSDAQTASAAAPGLVTVGSVHSRSTTTLEDSTVRVHAHTEVSDFDLLGLLHIDSIVTDVVASSSGSDTEVAGGTVVSGATFMDQPVIIDQDGIRTDPKSDSPQVPLFGAVRDAAPEQVLQMLEDAGIRITLPGPVAQDGESSGTMGSTGLRIDFELSKRTAPQLSQLADMLPPVETPVPGAPGIADALVFVKATHLVTLDVGRARVSLTARPGYVAPDFVPSTPVVSPSVVAAAPTPALSPPIARAPAPVASAAPVPAPAAMPTAPAANTETPLASLGAGIGALALLALLAQPFLGSRIARAGAAVLGTGPNDTCPLEET